MAKRRRAQSSLVDWSEPARNARVLDWRSRAHEFGLVPIADNGECPPVLVEPPHRLIEQEEPEAFGRPPIADSIGEDIDGEEAEQVVDLESPGATKTSSPSTCVTSDNTNC